MDIGFLGLGKMGGLMVQKLHTAGHKIHVYDTDMNKGIALAQANLVPQKSITDLVHALPSPKIIWVMVPSGTPTQETLDQLFLILQSGDIVIDGGNSNFKESMAFGEKFNQKGIYFLDVGTSGGVWGPTYGYCLMAGGDKKAVDIVTPIFSALADKAGFLHVGPSGAGHFTKMVHNAIEYGMMQAYGEGFALLEDAGQRFCFGYDLPKLAGLFQQGSVIRSWLLDLLKDALNEDPKLEAIVGKVPDSGEGRWAAKEAIDAGIATPVLTTALQMRFTSRQDNAFSARVCSALRKQFGGHAVEKK